MKFFGDVQGWLYGGAGAELRELAAGFDPIKLLAAMAIPAVFGMVHAFMPGHGKIGDHRGCPA
jgi:nickel/cobalt transporter (NicO) family protein